MLLSLDGMFLREPKHQHHEVLHHSTESVYHQMRSSCHYRQTKIINIVLLCPISCLHFLHSVSNVPNILYTHMLELQVLLHHSLLLQSWDMVRLHYRSLIKETKVKKFEIEFNASKYLVSLQCIKTNVNDLL